ncbi:MAG: hypothetical protein ACI4V5_07350 [Prevotella sp.]
METDVTTYRTLSEIRHKKEALQKEIKTSNKEIGRLWKNLTSPVTSKKNKKGFSMSSVMNMGMGAVDGLLLVWKLYRKFKK